MADLATMISEITDSASAKAVAVEIGRQQLQARDNQTRRGLNEIRKLLQHTIEDRLLPAMDYDERLDDLAAGWLELCEMFRTHLPAEVWERVSTRVEECFSKARVREGLKL